MFLIAHLHMQKIYLSLSNDLMESYGYLSVFVEYLYVYVTSHACGGRKQVELTGIPRFILFILMLLLDLQVRRLRYECLQKRPEHRCCQRVTERGGIHLAT